MALGLLILRVVEGSVCAGISLSGMAAETDSGPLIQQRRYERELFRRVSAYLH